MELNGFKYKKDGKLDTWRILTGPVKRGDCDDFAVSMLYHVAGKSLPRFWWMMLSGQAWFWFVTTERGNGHLMLWIKGKGWIDNRNQNWRKTCENRRWFPMLAPFVALKMALGKVFP